MKGDDNKQPAPARGDTAGWQYSPEDRSSTPAVPPIMQATAGPEAVEWTASEFVAHSKGIGWYALLGLGAILLAVVIFLFTRDVTSAGIIVLVAILLGVAANNKPRILHYEVNDSGLVIGQKFYSYAEFKSFSVMEEGAFSSIMFLPLRRFMPPISIYYDPQDEERIVEVLSYYLPMENRSHDVFDRLIKRIRF